MPVSWRVSFWKLRSNIQAFTWFYAGWEIWIQFQIWIFCMWISSFPVLTVEESPLPQWIFLLYLPTIRCCVHSLLGSLLYSVDLYVFVLLQCYFCYYSSAVYFKISIVISPGLLFLFKFALSIWNLLCFLMNFISFFLVSWKMSLKRW